MLNKNDIVEKYCSISLAYGKKIKSINDLAEHSDIDYKNASYQFRCDAISLLCEREETDATAIVPIPHAGVFLANCWAELRNEKLWLAFGYKSHGTSIFYTADDQISREKHCEVKVGTLIDLNKDYKKIILIDEDILSGVTMKMAIQTLRSHGVKEIHARTILPPYINKCPYSRINYKPTLTTNTDIAKEIGADDFSCLSMEDLNSLDKNQSICFECQMKNAKVKSHLI